MSEQQQALTSQQALDLAVQHHKAGRLSQAEAIYQQILQNDPNQPVALHLLGVIAHQTGNDETAVDLITKALAIKPDYAEAYSNLGNTLRELGRLDEAAVHCKRAIDVSPDFAEAHNNLGNVLRDTGELEEAVASYRKALTLKPDYTQAHYNLGNALRELGKLEEAVASYHEALTLKPDYAQAHYNLGNALHGLGRLEDAAESYSKALVIQPDYVEAHNNLGVLLQKLGKSDEALASCRKALALKPNHAKAHHNLGLTLRKLGKLEDALSSYRRALAILKPDYVEAHVSLGVVLEDLGELEEAISNYHMALAIQPDFAEAWNNLQFVAKALQFSETQGGRRGSSYKKGLSKAARASVDFAILEYYLAKFKPHKADKAVQTVMAALPPNTNEEVIISDGGDVSGTPPPLADKLVALLHFGRSGTGLLHSLVDGHPEVSTLPSIYLRGFFNAGVWNKISADGWRKLPERFADEFAVLFDANSSKTTPGILGEDSPFLGRKEGMTNVGGNRNESLSLDRDQFCSEALRLMEQYTTIDPKLFLLVVHAAFEKVLGARTNKHTVFYHLHGSNDFAKLNFLRYAPDARLLMMVREPVQSCESWVRDPYGDNDYNKVVHWISSMLFAIDQVAFRMRDSVGVRLEDLKTKPEATLRSLCTWLGIKETPSLYQMTAQGKKWWGDPTSLDYDANKAMAPFDEASTQRPVGIIFSEQDQFILKTLFYPFSVRFGYREADPVGFERDLKEIRPLFDKLLGFEKVISEKAKIDPQQLKRSASYLLLRASFMDRWNVLNEFKDYPHLLSPLKIPVN